MNKRKTATRYIDVATQQPAGRVLLRLSQSDLLGRLLLYDVCGRALFASQITSLSLQNRRITACCETLPLNSLGGSTLLRNLFIRWQHPAMWRGATLAVHCIIYSLNELTYLRNYLGRRIRPVLLLL